MRLQVIHPWSQDFAKAKALYLDTFPPEERVPIVKIIALTTLRPSTKLLGLYENDQLCGFSLTVRSKHYLYINFIAIDPACRGRGYGSRLINLLKRRYRLPIIALVKLPEYGAPEFEADRRRIRFWQNLGTDFFQYNYLFTDASGGHFAVGVIGGDYDRNAFREVLDQRSFHPAALFRSFRRILTGTLGSNRGA